MLSFRIALRYFLSVKSHRAVNTISAVSVAGVAVATAAIVIVLSVFNGFSGLAHSRFASIDPELTVVPVRGKVFASGDSLAEAVSAIEGVAVAVPALAERGMIVGADGSQFGVVFKGVGDGYDRIVDFDGITYYQAPRSDADTLPAATLAIGVASRLRLGPEQSFELMTLRRVGRINPANPATALMSQRMIADRVVSIDQMEFDADNMIIPIAIARELLQYDSGEASAIEIALIPGASASKVAERIERTMPEVKVMRREQLHGEAYRMIAVEKWVTFAMLIFILVIAAFNIISTLSLMVIEKRANMATLRFLGASAGRVRLIFAMMGAMITLAGGIIGAVLGVGLSLAQQWGGFIKLNGDAAMLSITEYPVRVEATDLAAVLAILVFVAACASLTTLRWRWSDT